MGNKHREETKEKISEAHLKRSAKKEAARQILEQSNVSNVGIAKEALMESLKEIDKDLEKATEPIVKKREAIKNILDNLEKL